MAKNKKLKINVLFDTNAIYTDSVKELLRKEIVDLIKTHVELSDVELLWYIPQIVIQERIFQMKKKGYELLPAIEKMEGLLGNKLNISKEIVEQRIVDNVNRQMNLHSVNEVKINISETNWESIIHKAVNRLPPFEDNKKEKGFRDAIILESLNQLIKNSPSSKSICRIIFVTNDEMLNIAALEGTKASTNINIVKQIDELVSLINIFKSEITEEFINKLSEKAEKLFLNVEDQSTLFYSEKIINMIGGLYSSQLTQSQVKNGKRNILSWHVGKPGFDKKVKQKVSWKTIIMADFQDSVFVNPEPNPFNRNENSGLREGGVFTISNALTNSIWRSIKEKDQQKELITLGNIKFEVSWTLTLTSTHKLTNPRIDSIKYIDTIFLTELPVISN